MQRSQKSQQPSRMPAKSGKGKKQDAEMEALMQQVLECRKKEKDYRNMEDQIRCLKQRLNYQAEMQAEEEDDGDDET